MARIDTLTHYLTDIADAIRTKTGSSDPIQASSFDTAIEGIPSGGGNTGYTGHVDAQGLLAVGWTQEDIDDFQENGIFWDADEDTKFALNSADLSGDLGTKSRYYGGDTTANFTNYYRLLAFPKSKFTNTSRYTVPFNNCWCLKYIPQITLQFYNFGSSVFQYCYSLRVINGLSLPYATTCGSLFKNLYTLERINNLSINNNFSGGSMFENCYSLKYVYSDGLKPNGSISKMFSGCHSLIAIPNLDTSNVTDVSYLFNECYSLVNLPELDFGKVKSAGVYSFLYCYSLVYLGGFKDYGKAFSTSQSANYSTYKLDLSSASLLTHDSLMNVINNLYDIATAGCNTQDLVLGSTNLAKLTAEEIAIATNKGWNVT